MKVKDFFTAFRKKRSRQDAREILEKNDPTQGYRPPRNIAFEISVEKLPLFTVYKARMMMRDPVVRIGLSIRNAILSAAEVEIDTNDSRVKKYIQEEWGTIWEQCGRKARRAKQYGYQALQFDYKRGIDGLTHIKGAKEFSPHDVRALLSAGRIVGFSVRGAGIYDQKAHTPRIYMPRGVWLTFDDEFGNWYGNPILKRSYSPWYEKWMPGGAIKTRQLRMVKDAYIGDVIRYPYDRTVTDHNGNRVPWRDVLREMSENRLSGATLMLPMLKDSNGQDLVDYQGPQDTGRPDGIYQWVDDIDRDIWRGLDVFEEVIHASETGSGYSGRSVPMAMCIQACQDELQDTLQQIDTAIFRPLVWYNFGRDIDYSVRAKPLLETFSDSMSGTPVGGAAMGGPGGQQPPQPPPQQLGAKPKGPPTKPPVQFSEGTEGSDLSYDPADAIAVLAAQKARTIALSAHSDLTKLLRRRRWQKLVGPVITAAGATALLQLTGEVMARFRERLTETTEDALMASSVAGVSEIQGQVGSLAATIPGPAISGPGDEPPPSPPPSTSELFDRPKRIRFPVEEEARKTLRGSTVFTGDNWRETAEAVKRGSFAVTSDMSDKITADIGDAVETALAEGWSRDTFVEHVRKLMAGEEGALSDARLELIYRNNTSAYLSNAAEKSLHGPMVVDAFPYRRYAATSDDRVRPEHWAMETSGLQGTNVFRGDDPAWHTFRPPWCWNCRCSWSPASVFQAAREGVEEAQAWVERAKQMAEQLGGVDAEYIHDTRPSQVEHVEAPTLDGVQIQPCEGWERDTLQFADRQKTIFGDWVEADHPREKKGKKEGGQFTKKEKQGQLWTGLDLLPGQRDFLDEGGDAITESTDKPNNVDEKTQRGGLTWKKNKSGKWAWFDTDRQVTGAYPENSDSDYAWDAFNLGSTATEDTSNADEADRQLIAEMDKVYGHLEISEIEAKIAETEVDISGLQRTGKREFTGTGTRRSGPAMANQAAREAGQEKLRLGVYLQHRKESEREAEQSQSSRTAPDFETDEKPKRQRDFSDQEIGWRSQERAWSRAMADTEGQSTKDLIRSRGYGEVLIRHAKRQLDKAEINEDLYSTTITGIRSELDNINRIIKERETGDAPDIDHETEAEMIASKVVRNGQNLFAAARSMGLSNQEIREIKGEIDEAIEAERDLEKQVKDLEISPARKRARAKQKGELFSEIQFEAEDTTAKEHKSKGGWKTVGGAPMYIRGGKITKGCEGVKNEQIETLIDESDESRERRARKGDKEPSKTGEFDFGANEETDEPDKKKPKTDDELFEEIANDVWKLRKIRADEYNALLNELVRQFVSTKKGKGGGGRLAAFYRSVKGADDPTLIPRFDEMTQMVRDNPKFGQLLTMSGESTGKGDIEHALFTSLKRGRMLTPKKSDPRIAEEAEAIFKSVAARSKNDSELDNLTFSEVYEACWDDFFQLGDMQGSFLESEHPRAPKGTTTGGEFVPKTGGQWVRGEHGGKGKEYKLTLEGGTDMPEHLEKLRLPPAWKDVWVNVEEGAGLQAMGLDEKGRRQSKYSDAHHKRQGQLKFAKITELQQKFGDIQKQNDESILNGSEEAACLSLIMKMGVRPGSNTDTKAKVQAYGATTLLGKHVVVDGDTVRLQFTGKKGVAIDLEVTDEKLKTMLVERKKRGDESMLFNTTSTRLLKHSHTLDGGKFRPKDFRTRLGTAIAAGMVSSESCCDNEKAYKTRVKEVASEVADHLGNTPAICLQAYIDPNIFAKWKGNVAA